MVLGTIEAVTLHSFAHNCVMNLKLETSLTDKNEKDSLNLRYLKLAVLVIVAGNIYPLIYLRQNFEVSLLDSLGITSQQLAQNYSMLGVIYMITYLPSGWLADRIAPRVLMSFSLLTTALLGIWFATLPSFFETRIIFAGWGLAAGLTFWAALIKATTLLARPDEQGRFFGILEGGRGLVEAVLATCAVALFAYAMNGPQQDTSAAMQRVIWMYVIAMLVLTPISYFALSSKDAEVNSSITTNKSTLRDDIFTVARQPQVWLCSVCILMGYQMYWGSYSFSAYLQNHYGLTAVTVGSIMTASLWMRPVGAVASGFIGDKINNEKTLAVLMILNAIGLVGLAYAPVTSSVVILLAMIIFISFLTYGIRGIYWATIERCDISNHVKGLAIGLISLIGYAPHAYLPAWRAYLIDHLPEKQAYEIYFCSLAGLGLLGAFAAWMLVQKNTQSALIE